LKDAIVFLTNCKSQIDNRKKKTVAAEDGRVTEYAGQVCL